MDDKNVLQQKQSKDILKLPQSNDILKRQQSSDILKQPQSSDILKQPQSNDILKRQQSSDLLKRKQSTDLLKQPESRDLLKRQQSSDLLKQPQSNDLLKRQQSSDLLKRQQSSDVLKQPQSNDILKRQQSNDLLKQPQSNDILKRQQSSDLLKQPQSNDILKRQQSSDLLKRPQASDLLKRPQASDLLKRQQSSDLLKQPQSNDLLKRQQSSDLLKRPQASDLLKRQQSYDFLRQKQSSDVLKQPQSSDLLQRPQSSDLKRQQSSDLLQRPQSSDLKRQQSSDLLQRPQSSDLKRQQSSDLLQRPQSSDLKRQQSSDLLQRPQSSDLLRRQQSSDLLQRPQSNDLLKRQQSRDLLKRPSSDLLRRQQSSDFLQRPHSYGLETRASSDNHLSGFRCNICQRNYDEPDYDAKGATICPKCHSIVHFQKKKEFEDARCDSCKLDFKQKDIKSYLPNGLPQCPNCKKKLKILDKVEPEDSRADKRRKFSCHISVCKKCHGVILMDKLPASNYLPDGRPFCGRCKTPLIDKQTSDDSVGSGKSNDDEKNEKMNEGKRVFCPKCKTKYDIELAQNGEITCKVCRWRIDCRERVDVGTLVRTKTDNPDILTCRKCKAVTMISHHPQSHFLPDGTPFCGRCKTPLKDTTLKIVTRKENTAYENVKKIECVKCFHIYDISTLPESYFLPDGSPRCPMCKTRHVFPPEVNTKERHWKPPERTVGRCNYCNKMIYMNRINSCAFNADGIPMCIRCSRPLLDDDHNPLYATIDCNSVEGKLFLEKCDMMDRMFPTNDGDVDVDPIENIFCSLDDGFVTCFRCHVLIDIKKAKRLRNGQPYCGNCKQPCFSVNDLPLTIQFCQNVNRFNQLYREQMKDAKTQCSNCRKFIDVLNLPLFCHLPNGEPICNHCGSQEALETDVSVLFSKETNEEKAKLGNLYQCTYCKITFALDKLTKDNFTDTGLPKCINCGKACFSGECQKSKEAQNKRRESIWTIAAPIKRDSVNSLSAIVNMREVLSDIAPYTRCTKCQQLLFHKNHPIDHFTPEGDLICTKCRHFISADTVGVDKGFHSLSAERRQKGMSMNFYLRKFIQETEPYIHYNKLRKFFRSLNNYGFPKEIIAREYNMVECYNSGYMGLKSPLVVNDAASAEANVVHGHQRLNIYGKKDDTARKNEWLTRLDNITIDEIDFKYSLPQSIESSDPFELPNINENVYVTQLSDKQKVHDRKVLVMVDDSEASKISFKWFVYNILDSQRDVVVLLMMIESHQYRIRNLEPPLIKQFGQEETFQSCINKFKKLSNRFTKLLDQEGSDYVILHSATCLPESTIVNVTYNQNPDLLVLAYQPHCLKFPVYRTLPSYLRSCLSTPMLFVNNGDITVAEMNGFLAMKKAKKTKEFFRRKTVRCSIMV